MAVSDAVLISTIKATKKQEQTKLDQTCTQANMLAMFPHGQAKDSHW